MVNENEVKELVAEILEMDVSEIPEEAAFVSDLGMDSLRALEILASLEKKYKMQIPPERLKDMSNMKSVIAVTKEIYEGSNN
ncbi:MAG: acyl carrier protein [Clostridia bacterium]|nr:acyl carrier protein [Clostridia bacterium]